MSHWGQLSFQDAASPLMIQLISFHDHAMLIITLVMVIVFYAFISLILNNFTSNNIFEAQEIETVWTILPAIILLFLALPSLRLLYLMDEITNPSFTMKTIGHQWYWSYEYSDFFNIEFDSYMTPTEDLKEGEFRLLEVDNRAVLPMQTEIRVLVTAADVIHSWAIPALGVKVDAIPGRLNQLGMYISRPGVFYGQCSEICGANHSFMPIAIETVDFSSFTKWISQFSDQ
uniref:cytochrome c oxidase subunit II n=1 Tax=Branchipolynoe onnuriensis TaxID=2928633 RepID=UPI0020796591|nr:cytochrome c oxidase subunit II [Branchipolynoe onnuriensis]URS74517.1 cytochrome c oxidase subunit 2 [Branchipolynoe onnuriensis]